MAFAFNNIKYRSVTSKALEWYYNSKAFILNELSDSRNDFSRGARELLLMMLNNYKEWTDFSERYLLDKKIVSEADIDLLIQKLDAISESNITIFESHTEVFPPELVKLWKKNRNTIRDFFIEEAKRECIGVDHLVAYPFLINTLLSALLSTMYMLYEIDCLLGCELLIDAKPITTNRSNPNRLIVLIDDDSIHSAQAIGVFSPYERLKSYAHYVVPNSPVLIKNLTSVELNYNRQTGELSGDPTLIDLVRPMVNEYNVIEIISVKS